MEACFAAYPSLQSASTQEVEEQANKYFQQIYTSQQTIEEVSLLSAHPAALLLLSRCCRHCFSLKMSVTSLPSSFFYSRITWAALPPVFVM